MGEFERNVAGIGALAEPVRRDLYLYVCAQPVAVSRDQAADAVGIARHQAKFHLDRLEADGLLETGYARVSGRSGPGAGRPSKLYQRSRRDIAVSLPRRSYEQAGVVMADAIADSAATGRPILEALTDAATAHGAEAGSGVKPSSRTAIGSAVEALRENGFEPRREGDRVVLLNCPFHALAAAHAELICGMNKAYVAALVGALGHPELEARLEAGQGRCCVTVATKVAH